jgi:hypothetical protein
MIDEKELADIRAWHEEESKKGGSEALFDAWRYVGLLLAALDEARAAVARATPDCAECGWKFGAHGPKCSKSPVNAGRVVLPASSGCNICGAAFGHNAGCSILAKLAKAARGEPDVNDGEDYARRPPGRATEADRSAADVLAEGAETFRERRKIYGDNYLKYGKLCEVLYPNGLTLRSADDFSRFELFTFILVKLSRFSNSGLTHKDSVHDAAVYCAMLEVLTTDRKVGDEI